MICWIVSTNTFPLFHKCDWNALWEPLHVLKICSHIWHDLICHLTSHFSAVGRARTTRCDWPVPRLCSPRLRDRVCRCHPLLVAIVTPRQAGQPGLLRLAQLECGSAGSLPPPSRTVMPGRPVPAAGLLGFHQACGEDQERPSDTAHRFNLIRVILTDYTRDGWMRR